MDHPKTLNPFVLGGVVTGRRFAGRASEIARLRALAAAGQHAYLFALRRYGKTSLLREAFAWPGRAAHPSLVWCDCLPTVDARGLAQRVGEAVTLACRRGRPSEWIKAAASLFQRLRPALSVGAEGDVHVTLEVARTATGPLPDLEDALAAIQRLAESKLHPIVLVFDEFQQVAEWDSHHQTEAVIRTAVQQFRRVACVFAGSQRHLLQQMFADRARPLFKLAAPFPLARLTRDELEPWLVERFGDTGQGLDREAADAILRTAAGHPWATQYLAHFVWEKAVARSARRVTAAIVSEALGEAQRASGTVYAAEYSALTVAQRRVLLAITSEPTSAPTAAAYLARQDLPAKSTTSQALRSLLEKGYLENQDGQYLVSDPLLGEWLRRQHEVTATARPVTDT